MTYLLRIILALPAVLPMLAGFVLIELAEELPTQVQVSTLEITLPVGAVVTLGAADFIEAGDTGEGRFIASRHLALSRLPDGSVVAHDLAPNRRVGLRISGGYYDQTGELVVPEGWSRLHTGDAVWEIDRVGPVLTMRGNDGRTEIRADGWNISLAQDGVTIDQTAGAFQRAKDRVRWLLRDYSTSLSFGGAIEPSHFERALSLGLVSDAALPRDAFRMIFTAERRGSRIGENLVEGPWILATGNAAVRLELPDGRSVTPEARALPILDASGASLVQGIIVGRTSLTVESTGMETLRLRPVSRAALTDPVELVAPTPGVIRNLTPPRRVLEPSELRMAAILAAGLGGLLLAAGLALRLSPDLLLAAGGFGFTLAPHVPIQATPMAEAIGLSLLSAAVLVVARELWTLGSSARAQSLVALEQRVAQKLVGHRLLIAIFLAAGAFVLWFAGNSLPAKPGALEIAVAGALMALAAPFLSNSLRPATTLILTLVVGTAAFGAVGVILLSAQEPNALWRELLDKHLLAIGAIGIGMALALALSDKGWHLLPRLLVRRRRWSERSWRRFALTPALIGLALATLVSDETGIAGLVQPGELAKTVLILLLATTLAQDLSRRTMLSASRGGHSWWPVGLAIAYALVLMGTSVLNHDMSPILVTSLAILGGVTAGAHLYFAILPFGRLARRHRGLPIVPPINTSPQPEVRARRRARLRAIHLGRWPLYAACAIVTLWMGAAALIWMTPALREGAAFDLNPALHTPWQRVQSWHDVSLAPPVDEVRFPDLGNQVRNAREALLHAGCRGFATFCPASILPGGVQRPADASDWLLRVPAVQDDFAVVALSHALGLDGLILYAALQAALVAAGLSAGILACRLRDDRRFGGWVVGVTAIGTTALYLGQIAAAWGNALGALPVMGQPMTFVSMGGSHHLGFALPFAISLVLAAQLIARPASQPHAIRAAVFRRSPA